MKTFLFYFTLVFMPSLILGLWQLYDDNILKEKYERKLSKEERTNKIIKAFFPNIFNFPDKENNKEAEIINSKEKEIIKKVKNDFLTWCNAWENLDMSPCKSFSEEKYHEINNLQIEGYVDTKQRRHLDVDEATLDISLLNLYPYIKSKTIQETISDIKSRRKNRIKFSKDNELYCDRLRFKVTGNIADYQTSMFKDLNNAIVYGSNEKQPMELVLDYILVDKEHPHSLESWKFIGTKAYNDFLEMKEKSYPEHWDKLLHRNKFNKLIL